MIANNTTANIIENNGLNVIWVYVIWICFFFTTSLPNLIIAITVIRYKALRDRHGYLILAGLSLADFLNITCYSGAGIHRLLSIFQGRWTTKVSLLSCTTLVQNMCWWVAGPLSGIMLLVISLDRFISVAAPIKYFKFTKKYAFSMLGTVYGLCISTASLYVVSVFAQKNRQSAQIVSPCFTGSTVLATNKYFAIHYMYSASVSGLLSVVLYCGVGMIAYWKRKHVVAVGSANMSIVSSNQSHERKRQRCLTKNLALSCFWTTILVIIPNSVAHTGEVYGWPRWLLQFLWLLPPINPFCNIVIYYRRQMDLKIGIRALLTNKMMPSNLELWHPIVAKSGQPANSEMNG